MDLWAQVWLHLAEAACSSLLRRLLHLEVVTLHVDFKGV